MAAKPLTVVGFMHILETDEVIPVEDLTADQKKRCRKIMKDRLESGMNQYYKTHPDDFEKLST